MDLSIGVTTHPLVSGVSLKKGALLFDAIVLVFPNLTNEVEVVSEGKSFDATREYIRQLDAEIDWLYQNGILVQGPSLPDPEIESDPDVLRAWNGSVEGTKEVKNLEMQGLTNTPAHILRLDQASNELARASTVRLRRYGGINATPMWMDRTGMLVSQNSGNDPVVSVILDSLPEPDDSTPWEKILEFRRDMDAKTKLNRLKRWMGQICSTNASASELNAELQYLLQEYEDHMRLHHMKVNKGTFETLIISGLEILENLVRLQPSKSVKSLFAFRERRIALWEAERQAPGREIAYIAHAERAFSKRR